MTKDIKLVFYENGKIDHITDLKYATSWTKRKFFKDILKARTDKYDLYLFEEIFLKAHGDKTPFEVFLELVD